MSTVDNPDIDLVVEPLMEQRGRLLDSFRKPNYTNYTDVDKANAMINEQIERIDKLVKEIYCSNHNARNLSIDDRIDMVMEK